MVLHVHRSLMSRAKASVALSFPCVVTSHQEPQRDHHDQQRQDTDNNVRGGARSVTHSRGQLLNVDRLREVLVNAGHDLDVGNDHGRALDHVEEAQVAAAVQGVGAHVEGFQRVLQSEHGAVLQGDQVVVLQV